MTDIVLRGGECGPNSRFSVGIDEDDDGNPIPMILWVPNINKFDHSHIGLSWEGAVALRDWLDKAISERSKK